MATIKKLVTYQSINYDETEKLSKMLAYKIQKEYQPELLLFIARGGHIVAKEMQEVFHIPMIDIDCSSNTDRKSDILMPYLPEIAKKTLRTRAVLKQNPTKPFTKNITYSKQQWKFYQTVNKILIIDDTIETGKTIRHILPIVQDYFQNADIKIATLSNFDFPNVDYQVYQNKILAGPWGRDSKEYQRFVQSFKEYTIAKKKKEHVMQMNRYCPIQKRNDISYVDHNHVLAKNKVKIKSFTK